VISGRDAADCDEAAGATRVKRLRDALGNQMVSELLVKTIARRGYMLAVGRDVIRVV
jgi:DNA-binding winged helix-turn-helix (wHTH) protein